MSGGVFSPMPWPAVPIRMTAVTMTTAAAAATTENAMTFFWVTARSAAAFSRSSEGAMRAPRTRVPPRSVVRSSACSL